MKDLELFLISPDSTIKEAIARIDRNATGIVLLVDDQKHLVGTVTDGDIRRAVLDGVDLEKKAKILITRSPESPYQEPVTIHVGKGEDEALALMKSRLIRHLPVLDDGGRVVDLLVLDELVPVDLPALRAVIMAGGRGERLKPLTDDTPKPLLHVGNRPIMEHIVDQLRQSKIQNLSITTHYQADKIISHFGDGEEFGVHIDYVPEDKPLGTAGALALLKDMDEPLLVINGDILTNVNFRAMHDFHREHHSELTVAVRQYDFQIPFGVVESDGSTVVDIQEKPEVKVLVSAGIYLLQPSVRKYIPLNEHYDMPSLIRCVIADGGHVVNFPIVEYWLDIGHHGDYEKAQSDVRDGGVVK